jgi:hypothetical protein
MYQAIVTKYLGPSNVRGSRVKATAEAGSVTLHWDDAKDTDQNHQAAARALAVKFGWDGIWHGGALPGNAGYVFVNEDVDNCDRFTVTTGHRPRQMKRLMELGLVPCGVEVQS